MLTIQTDELNFEVTLDEIDTTVQVDVDNRYLNVRVVTDLRTILDKTIEFRQSDDDQEESCYEDEDDNYYGDDEDNCEDQSASSNSVSLLQLIQKKKLEELVKGASAQPVASPSVTEEPKTVDEPKVQDNTKAVEFSNLVKQTILENLNNKKKLI